ncbi:helix-turn-helix domain-containing protein [Gordonia sp. MP11Mi]|uniref:Helix-turn-helix domain-containing protein n=1 Tax=Gordonia sp. MP11Mi TaxID=3022769 RepID=A0AA97CVK9_9ACTN
MVEPARGVILTLDDARRVCDTFLTMQRQLGATGARIALPVTRLFEEINAATQGDPRADVGLLDGVFDTPEHEIREHTIGTDAAAVVLGITASAVRDLARRGTLPGRQVSGRWVFARYDVEAERARRRHHR